MKKIIPGLLVIGSFSLFFSCNNSSKKETGTTETSAETTTGTDQNTGANDIASNDDRVSNAGDAKRPKGKMSYKIDGQPVTIDENMVQCMYIGMNSTMAQSVISGGNQVSIVHMGVPKVGDVKIGSVAGMPDVGLQVIIDGVQYNNKKAAETKLTLTKVTPDGKNYYVAGTFSGTLTSIDGKKTITITDGVFESAYL
jgi:Mycobacterium 19 kDa lipoprotein antigen